MPLSSQAQIESPVAQGTAGPARASERSVLVDVVRGVAIALVVLGHTNQGVYHRGWWGPSRVGLHLEAFIYSFHMPAFFFISGIFLPAGVAKRGARRFLGAKVSTMLWPYVLWTTLGALATLPLGRFLVQQTPSLRDFMVGVLTGKLSWFLPTIFFAVFLGMLGALAQRHLRVPLWVFFLLTVALAMPAHGVGITFIDRAILHLPFLAAGMWAGRSYERLERVPAIAALPAALVLGLFLLYATSFLPIHAMPLFLLLGLLGTLMLFLLARVLGRSAAARLFSWWGEASFGIFLLSAYFQGLGRELLRAVHITAPYPQLLVPTVLAMSIPAWLYQHRVRLRMAWMFAWPFGAKI